MNQNRHPSGSSRGGQWAPGSSAEIEDTAEIQLPIALRFAATEVTVRDGVTYIDDDGIVLDEDRQKRIPEHLRRECYSRSELPVVAAYCPELDVADQEASRRFLTDCRPDGLDHEPASSYLRDKQAWQRENEDKWTLDRMHSDHSSTVVSLVRGDDQQVLWLDPKQAQQMQEKTTGTGQYRPDFPALADDDFHDRDVIDRYGLIRNPVQVSDLDRCSPGERADIERDLDAPVRLGDETTTTTMRRLLDGNQVEYGVEEISREGFATPAVTVRQGNARITVPVSDRLAARLKMKNYRNDESGERYEVFGRHVMRKKPARAVWNGTYALETGIKKVGNRIEDFFRKRTR